GRLTETELMLIREHPEAGYAILSDIEFEQPVADIVLQHHERLDGSGYPHGLRGDAIRLEARVLAVADVFEAMVSHRPYRAGLTRAHATVELQQGAGVLYDPSVADACLRLVEEGFE